MTLHCKKTGSIMSRILQRMIVRASTLRERVARLTRFAGGFAPAEVEGGQLADVGGPAIGASGDRGFARP